MHGSYTSDATALRQLEDPQQETPLTIALLGDWGAGKSTLMALLRERLLQGRPRRFCFADFNAWEYELTDNMAAGLAQEVVAGLVHDSRLEEFLHETPAPAQADLERALKGDRLAARRLAPELADRVEVVRKLDLPSSDLGAHSAGAHRSSRLADQTTRDFVRLVVLPASPAEPPPKAKRSSAKRRRPGKQGNEHSQPSAGARAGRRRKTAENETEGEAPVPPISPKPS